MKLREKNDRRSLKESDEDDHEVFEDETSDSDHFENNSKPSSSKKTKKPSLKSASKKTTRKKRQKIEPSSEKSQYFSTENDEEKFEPPPIVKKSTSKTTVEDDVADVLGKMEVDLNEKPKASSKQNKPVAKKKKKSSSKEKKKQSEQEEEDETSEEEDWEEVRMEHHVNLSAIGRDPIQVVLNDAGKKSSKPLDPRAKYERMLKAFKKKLAISSLKTHLVCWLAHGFYLNRLCLENDELKAIMLSYSDRITCGQEFDSKPRGFDSIMLKTFLNNANKLFLRDSQKDLTSVQTTSTVTVESIQSALENARFISYLEYILALIIAFRNMGLKTRLCVCFDVLQVGSEYKALALAIQNTTGVKEEIKEDKIESIDANNNNNNNEKVEDKSSNNNKESKQKPLFKNKPLKKNNQILSNDEESQDSIDDDKQNLMELTKTHRFYWIEVYLDEEKRWCPVEPLSAKIDCVKYLEERFGKRVLYVCSFDNDNKVKDITKRYSSEWTTKTRLLRVSHLEEKKLWWEKTLLYIQPLDANLDIEEEKQLKKMLLDQALPSSVSEFKDHPMYVMPRHLLKFQAIFPQNAIPVTNVRDEPVYLRDNLVTLHSRQTWLKYARVVKPFEKPYKIVKGRIKQSEYKQGVRNNPELDLYGYWQTKVYDPPLAENGRVPRNEFGNVELFQTHMLPRGCVHLRGMPNLNRLCRKLGLDCAAAVVGFDAHGGFSHAVYDGWVVCVEHRDLIVDAYRQEEAEALKRTLERNTERILGNWKKLVKGVLIRERLKLKYGDGNNKTTASHSKITNKMLTEMSGKSKSNHVEEINLDEVKFSGDQEIVGGKLNCENKKEVTKTIMSLNQEASTLKTNAIRAKRPTRTANKKTKSKKSKKTESESDEEAEFEFDFDEEYKPKSSRSGKKRSSNSTRKKPKSSSDDDNDEPPFKRPSKKSEEKPKQKDDVLPTTMETIVKNTKFNDNDDLNLSESDED